MEHGDVDAVVLELGVPATRRTGGLGGPCKLNVSSLISLVVFRHPPEKYESDWIIIMVPTIGENLKFMFQPPNSHSLILEELFKTISETEASF